ncbi:MULTISPECIES: crAss001_48 related protein [Vibrio]|uniref:Uncharacterized protein n=1 Tax=Vibrio crassostreae TaxID=246167 RepID=A0A822MMS2_9VIBR|nr:MULTISPECIES: hypothetical protein [Vibrio]CAH7072940.1 conserved hypothetical protein [Vibrio chagasii]OEE56790.1 hypothetical protein A146_03555 [Vibrio splendidus FF-500]TCM98358.1 hypothetical protein EDB35_1552 [Vibrio crassostreae]CAH7304188.1 conserved hypothetical protein [Vibrio chagasii]CAH7394854.1 conserved hypothetical protein [Vibrio chagasii]
MSKPEHLIRMEKEFNELNDRLEKLRNFIGFNQKFRQLSETEKKLMIEQFCGMSVYASALWLRICLSES